MGALPTANWANFFTAEAGASAALAGLLFVALSINLPRILAVPHLPGLAGETLAMLVGVLVVCGVGLVPGESAPVLGAQYLTAGLLVWLLVTTNEVRRARLPARTARWRIVLSNVLEQGGTLPFMIAGALLLAGHLGGLYWLVPGVIFSLLASGLNAWVLLVEIVR